MDKDIDLGTSQREAYNMDNPHVTGNAGDDTVYPEFQYRGPLDLDLPECGEMTICFRKLDERHVIDPDTGKHTHYDCRVQVREIKSVKETEREEGPARSYDEASDALDKIVSEMSKEDND